MEQIIPSIGNADGFPGGGVPAPTPTNPSAFPFWFKFTVTHTELQAAALQNDIEVYSLPAACVIHGAQLKNTIQFVGTGITDYKTSIGIVGNLESLLPLEDVDIVPANDEYREQLNLNSYNKGAVTSIRINAESVGANLDQSTAGELCVWLQVSKAAL